MGLKNKFRYQSMLDEQASGISHSWLLDVKLMRKKFQCERKVSGLGGAGWRWLAGSWSYP